MFWLAGILGLFAVGSLAFGGSDSDAGDEQPPEVDSADDSAETAATVDFAELIGADATDPVPMGDAGPAHGAPDNGAPDNGTPDNGGPDTGTPGEIVPGGAGDDVLTGSAGADQINGYAGDDTVAGGDGADSILGEDGDDSLSGDAGDDSLAGQNHDDSLSGGVGDDLLIGGDGDDRLDGDAGDDALHGGLGDDTLSDGAGRDTLFGGWGNDLISGLAEPPTDADADYLNGGGGADTLIAGPDDIVTAGEDDDTIIVGDWATDEHAAELLDFDPAEDQLVVVWDLGVADPPTVEVIADADVPGLSHVTIDGAEVAQVHAGGRFTAGDVILIGPEDAAIFGLPAA